MLNSRATRTRLCALVIATTALSAALGSSAHADVLDAPVPHPLSNVTTSDMVSAASMLALAPASKLKAQAAEGSATLSPQSQHTVDVAVVIPTDSAGWLPAFSDANVAALIAKVGTYWNSQTDGQVAEVKVNAAIQRYSSGYRCSDQRNEWLEAAAKFGRSVNSYISTGSRHLIVLAPSDCGGGGLGTVGSGQQGVPNTSNGGMVWSSLNGINNLDNLAHEFGHNLGLQHSNTHYCPSASISEGIELTSTTFSDGCSDEEYGDSYDVMGAAWSVGGNANSQPTALNATQRDRLVPAAPGTDQTIALPAGASARTFTASLVSTGQTTGLRDLKITDPRTGELYYVDFRGGGGEDAGSLYSAHLLARQGVDTGVRLLTVRPDGSSVVLLSPDPSSPRQRKLFLTAGQQISTRSGGVTVKVTSTTPTLASVSVSVSTPISTTRISGIDRYSTAIALSQSGYPSSAPIVYLATGGNYPDALAAAPAAALKGGPLLLTPSDSLPSAVGAEIARLHPARIVVVGGTSAVSPTVIDQLSGRGAQVDRISGVDRYSTAAAIVKDAFTGAVTSAYVATALNYPDALSAAAAAGAKHVPVLLVDGQAGSVDTSTLALIRKLGILTVKIAGGAAVVSTGVEAALKSRLGVGNVTRLGGTDRFQTSQIVSKDAFATGASEMFFATGYQFPDALAGAALAGARKAPLYVVPSNCVPSGVVADISSLSVKKVTLIGGMNALNDSVASMKTCP